MKPSRRKRLRNRLLRRVFELSQRVGLDVLPRHYYSSIPDVRSLRRSERWRPPRSMIGVAGTDLDEQLRFVEECCPPTLREEVRRRSVYHDACDENGAVGFGPIEADFLFCFVAARRPRRVVQVGAGVSTSVILRAGAHVRHDLDVTCVDPYPTDFLRRAAAESRITLVEEPAQEVPLEVLTGLGPGDLLFVDSTHTVGPDSEVNRIVLEVLPRLQKGSFVHFHDLLFPYDYARDLLSDALFFWNETALVHAFLVGNDRFRLAASLSMLHYGRTEELRSFLPNYRPEGSSHGLAPPTRSNDRHFPSSTYLEAMR